jgi:diguanylate cyclase (GGDEF)-like protein
VGQRSSHPPRRDPDPASLAAAVDAALVGHRSLGELLDTFLGSLARVLGPTVRVAVRQVADDGGRLVSQVGHHAVVQVVARDGGADLAVPLVVAAQTYRVTVESDADGLPDWLAAALVAAVARLAPIAAAADSRSHDLSPSTGLSRLLLRIGALDDPDRLLELTCRTVGTRLGLDTVQCFLGAGAHALEETMVWRRGAGLVAPLDAASADEVAATAGWEPGTVAFDGQAIVVVPLRVGPQLLGLVAGSPRAGNIAPGALEEAEIVAAHAASVLANLRRYESVVAASLTDALTGLPNHRRFHEDTGGVLDASRSGRGRFTIVVADLDDFKDLNDRRGHVAGDDALRLVGSLLMRGIRPDDRAYRLGGEEFGLLLPETSKTNARTVCRRLQRALAQVDLDGWRLTQSMGVASYPEDGETIRDLLAAADAALYEAKRLGKDRITLADDRLSARRTLGETMAVRGRRSFEQMRHLQALASTLAGARTPAAVGAALVDELAHALPGELSAVLLVEDGAPVQRALRGDAIGAGAAIAALASRAIAESRSFLVDDAADAWQELAIAGLHGAVAAPLVAESRVVGAIVVLSRLPSRYDRDDQRLLDVIAHLGGLAAENLRLLATRTAAGLAELVADVEVLAAADPVLLRRMAVQIDLALRAERRSA